MYVRLFPFFPFARRSFLFSSHSINTITQQRHHMVPLPSNNITLFQIAEQAIQVCVEHGCIMVSCVVREGRITQLTKPWVFSPQHRRIDLSLGAGCAGVHGGAANVVMLQPLQISNGRRPVRVLLHHQRCGILPQCGGFRGQQEAVAAELLLRGNGHHHQNERSG